MLKFETTGSFEKTERFLARMKRAEMFRSLDKFARQGVAALSSATPVASGLTGQSWDYEIKITGTSATITWTNSHVVNGIPIVILLQSGHGTGTGGYVAGRDFINPALKPVFAQIEQNVWKAVTAA